jgi:branched-chain amino acid transport system ATP-binding protein
MNDHGPALAVRSLSRSFSGLRAVSHVSFEVPPGAITAIIGPNGAGKTTLFNLLTNLYRPDGGRALLFRRDLRGRSPQAIARMGMVRTFQSSRVFSGMTVLENVLAGARKGTPRERAEGLLEVVGLGSDRDREADTLSVGAQKMLELARALMTSPRVLLLDEPAGGLNDAETGALSRLILAIRDAGVTVVVVEHNMSMVMSTADDVVVLDAGTVIAHGPPSRVRKDPAVIGAYLGQEVSR